MLGGRRVGIERPPVGSDDGRSEVRLRTYEYFADRDPEPERDLDPIGRDPERDDVRPLAELDAVDHHHRQAKIVEAAALALGCVRR